ncbi:MAG: thioredoxin domain-containing protein [bacterium]|jgi:protein-disulfide isomerase|nr:thioredoxin domain-containing protein [bacterium]
MESQKSLLDTLPSRQSFWLGFITAILSLCTLGFILLGSMMLNGSGLSFATADAADDDSGAAAVAVADAEPTTVTGVPIVDEDDYIRGNVDAEITIIEYSDFECPFCQRFHPTVQQALDEYGDQVRWVFRHFPLSFHANAESAALAAECAGEQGNDYFWEFGDLLFENMDSLGESTYQEIVAEVGVNASDWQTCFDEERYISKIRTQAQEGGSAGVTGTPGSFIVDADGNAIPLKGALPYSSVSAAIDSLL